MLQKIVRDLIEICNKLSRQVPPFLLQRRPPESIKRHARSTAKMERFTEKIK